jgi:hypothetical protein
LYFSSITAGRAGEMCPFNFLYEEKFKERKLTRATMLLRKE